MARGPRVKKVREPNRPKPYRMFSQGEAERFVDVWQRADRPGDVADLFDISIKVCYSLASRLRRKGVPLKKFTNRSKYDASALATIVKRSDQ
jgi:hypothetical protein